jgi:gp16 family phage-associated protein
MTKRTTQPQAHSRAVKTAEQVRAEFDAAGVSVAEWARLHGLNRVLVYRLLSGTHKGLRGQSHRAAVLLGLKAGRLDTSAANLGLSRHTAPAPTRN